MTSSSDIAVLLRRHAPALGFALVLHMMAAAVLGSMSGTAPQRKEEPRKVVAELIQLPQRIETPAPVRPATQQAPAVPRTNTPAAPKARLAPSPSAPVAQAPAAEQVDAPPVTHAAAAPPAPAATAPVPPAVTAPRFDAAYLNNPRPAYPLAARKLGEEGTVMLHVRVSAEGTPASIEVRASSGSERLDEAARSAVAQWRFVPAKQGDEPVAAWVLVPLVFKMNG